MNSIVTGSKAYEMPQKVLFKRSESVVNHRKVALGNYLKQCIDCCSAYGTEEQDLIFRFLNAYENIIHTVELDQDTRSVLESLEDAYHSSLYDDATSTRRRHSEEFSTCGYDATDGLEDGHETKDGKGDDNMNWKTPFAAAVLTAWVVISMMGPSVV